MSDLTVFESVFELQKIDKVKDDKDKPQSSANSKASSKKTDRDKPVRDKTKRYKEKFDLPSQASANGRITWRSGAGLKNGELYINDEKVAQGAALIAGGEFSITLRSKNQIKVKLEGQPGATLAVTVLAQPAQSTQPGIAIAEISGPPLYQGGRAQLTIKLPKIELKANAKFVALPSPGLRGQGQEAGQPIPLARVNAHTATIKVQIEPDAPLGLATLSIQDQARAVAAGNVAIRSVLPVGNGLIEVATLALAKGATLNAPQALTCDQTGRLWIADTENHVVRLLTKEGKFSTAAGNGKEGYADGKATQAKLRSPAGLAVTQDGSKLYVADTGNNCIRLLADDKLVTLAGSTNAGFADGSSSAARFNKPTGLALAQDGTLYVADTGNHAIRRINSNGVVTTVVGNGKAGSADGPAKAARLDSPRAISFAPNGTLYISDNHRIRALGTDGMLRTIAGTNIQGYRADHGSRARFSRPGGLVWSADRLIVADTGNGLIREVRTDRGLVFTLAGGGDQSGNASGDQAQLLAPAGIARTNDGEIIFCDSSANRLINARPARSFAMQVLSPPARKIVTGERSLLIRGRTNRVGAVAQAEVSPPNILNQNLQAIVGNTGTFDLPVYLTDNAVNKITLKLSYQPTGSGGSSKPKEEISRTIEIRSQVALADLSIIRPIDDDTFADGDVEVEVSAASPLADNGIAIVAAGVPFGAASADGKIKTSFSMLGADILLEPTASELAPFPIEAFAFVSPDKSEGMLAAVVPSMIRTPRTTPALNFVSPQNGETVSSSRIDVTVASDRVIVSGDVNGVPINADGTALGVPLTSSSATLIARIYDYRNQMAEQSIMVKLAEEIPPKVLLPEAPPPAVAAPGEVLTLTGTGLGATAQSVEVPTLTGYAEVPINVIGPDQIQITLPENAINGSVVIIGGGDAELLPLNLKTPALVAGNEADQLRARIPLIGNPTGANAYLEDEYSLRIDWRPDTTVGTVNEIITGFGLRIVGTRLRPSVSNGDPQLYEVTTWCGVAPENFASAIRALRNRPQVYTAFNEANDAGVELHTISHPSSLNNDWMWEPFISPSAQGSLPNDVAMLTTWQLQYPRFPAVWNIKAKATKQADAVISDSITLDQALQSDHEDVALPLAGQNRFSTGIASGNAVNLHGLAVSSVFGAKHNGRAPNNRGIDGANPLADANPNRRTASGAATPPLCNIIAAPNLKWQDVAQAITANTRVINCSYGLINKAEFFFNANLARHTFYSTGYSDFVGKFLPVVEDTLADVLALPTVEKVRKKELGDIFKALINLRNQETNDKWQNPERFYSQASALFAKYVIDQNAQPTPQEFLYQKFLERMDGFVVASDDHSAKLPQDGNYIAYKLIKTHKLDEFVSQVPGILVQNGAILVNSAGNDGNLLPPPTNQYWWGTNGVPSGLYNSIPGIFVAVVQRADLFAFVTNPDERDRIISVLLAANHIITAGGLMIQNGSITRWNDAGNKKSTEIKNPGSYIGQVHAPSFLIRAAKKPVSEYHIPSSNDYSSSEGTSYAAPLVSALIAYLFALDPDTGNKQIRARELHDAILASPTANLGAGIEERPILDAYFIARRFLSFPQVTDQTDKRYRFFDRAMCDTDDGTPHGNDSNNEFAPLFSNAGRDVEWLEGDGQVDMADLRSFRDAFLQIHCLNFAERQTGNDTDHNYTLRLRDLNASGAEPWTNNNRSVENWPRFDFDGSGKLEKDERQWFRVRDLTDLRNAQNTLRPGSELALIASLWPEDDGEEFYKNPDAYKYEFVPRLQLRQLLLSCDLRVPFPAMDELLKLAVGEDGMALKPKDFIEKIVLIIEDDTHLYDRKDATSGLYRRTISGETFEMWQTAAMTKAAACRARNINCRDELFLTIPLIRVENESDLARRDFPERIRVRGELVLSKNIVTKATSESQRMLGFLARFQTDLAQSGAAETDCGWIRARVGGRYPVMSFQIVRPTVSSISPTQSEQGKSLEATVMGTDLIPNPNWLVKTIVGLVQDDKDPNAPLVSSGMVIINESNTTETVKVSLNITGSEGAYKVAGRRDPAGMFGNECCPKPSASFTVKPAQQNQPPKIDIGTKPVAGNAMVATYENKLCLICPPHVITMPIPPLHGWYRWGSGGGANSSGGGGGGGAVSGSRGWAGFYGFGGSWGSQLGTIPCFISLLSGIFYKDSNFEITATVSAPPGTEVALNSQFMSGDDGLAQVSASNGGGAAAFAASASASPAASMASQAAGSSEASDSMQFSKTQNFTYVVRGVKEGLRPYAIKVEGKIRPEGDTGPGQDWGPMTLEGQLEIAPPFFLVGVTFTSDYLESGETFQMITSLMNSPKATETAFDTVLVVSGQGADIQDAVRQIGDLEPGESVVEEFTLTSELTGPITGVTTRTTGNVAVSVNVAGQEASAPPYPIQGSPGLSYILARYAELTKAIIALAGGAYADGLLNNDSNEMEAGVAVASSLHRAGFRLMAGEDDASVIGELVLDTLGSANASVGYDNYRRTTPAGRRVREAAGRAFVQAANQSNLDTAAAFFNRLAESFAGRPVALWMNEGATIRLEMADGEGRSLGAAGFAGETRDLPFAELYTEDWPSEQTLLAMSAIPPVTGELLAATFDSEDALANLTAAIPAPGGGLVLARWSDVRIPAGGRARLPFERMPSIAPDLRLQVISSANVMFITPTEIVNLPDPLPRALTAAVVPERKGGAPYHNIEVRFSEELQPETAKNFDNYTIPGYRVLVAAWYPPTRSAYLFVDNPVVGDATLRIAGVKDLLGQVIVPTELSIRGAKGGVVQGRVFGPDDQPVPGAEVLVLAEAFEGKAVADEEGIFTVDRVPVGPFRVEATDRMTGRAGAAEQTLVFDGQEIAVAVNLMGDAVVAGQVIGSDNEPIADAEVQVTARWPFAAKTKTDTDGFFRINRVPLSGFSVVAADDRGRAASASGTLVSLDQIATVQLIISNAQTEPVRIQGRVLAPNSAPLPGSVVRLERGDYIAQEIADEAGSYAFASVSDGDYIITAQDSFGRNISQEVLVANQDITLDLQLAATGVVVVRAVTPDGRTVTGARAAVTAQGFASELRTDLNGEATFRPVPAGTFDVKVQFDDSFGEASATLAEFQQLAVTVPLQPKGFPLPITLKDANDIAWSTITGAAIALSGTEAALGRLSINGATFNGGFVATVFTPGLEAAISQTSVGGVDVERRFYVSPRTGFFARLIDTLTNPGTEPVIVNVELSSAAPGYAPISATFAEQQSRFILTKPGSPSLGVVWAGDNAAAQRETGFVDGRAFCRFQSLTLAPGQSVSFLHFIVSRPAIADAIEAAAVLATPPPETLETISRAVAARLINFALPEATGDTSARHPLLAFGRIEARARTADDFAISLARVSISSHSSLFDRAINGSSDLSGVTFAEPVPVGDVTVNISHPLTGATGSATGQLTERGGTLVVNAKLANSGTIEGHARRADGSTAPQCDVYINGAKVGTSLDGRFRLRGVALGNVNLRATERQTGLTGSENVALLETGATVIADVRLPATGTVTGRVLAADGLTPLSGLPVTLGVQNLDNRGSINSDTDSEGRFVFPGVPAGEFTLSASNPETGAAASASGRVNVDGETVSVDLTLNSVGIIYGRVTDWEGLAPQAGARVELVASDNRLFVSTTDLLGRYGLAGVPGGPFMITAIPAKDPGRGLATGFVSEDGSRTVINVKVDQKPPVISLQSPEPNAVVDDTSATVIISIIDNETGIDEESVSIGLNGANVTRQFLPAQDNTRRALLNVGERLRLGSNTIEVVAADKADNRASSSSSFRIAAANLALTLRDQAGNAIDGAQISVSDRLGAHNLTSDADGKAQLTVPLGVLSIEAISAEGSPDQKGISANALAELDGETIALDLTLIPTGRVTVEALSLNGVTPAPNAAVILLDAIGSPAKTGVTDDFGICVFPSIALGTFTIRVTVGAEVGETTGTLSRAGQNAQVTVIPGGGATVAGTVRTSSGAPVFGANITFRYGVEELRQSVTDENGSFSFAGLRAGQFFQVEANDPASGLGSATSGRVPASGTTLQLLLTLRPAGTITGLVINNDLTPAAGAAVTYSQGDESPTRDTIAGSDGRFAFPFVRLGGFNLMATTEQGDYGTANGSIDFAGQARELTVKLTGLARLTVTVADGAGQPIEGAQVIVYTRSNGQEVTTDANGQAFFANVLASAASITATEPVSRQQISASIDLEAGQTATVNLAFPATGVISGRVLRSNGAALGSNAVAQLSSPQYINSKLIAADGSFRFDNLLLSASPYQVFVFQQGNLRGQSELINLESNGQEIAVEITIISLGTIKGKVFAPNGAPAPFVSMILTSTAQSGGGTRFANSAFDGSYEFADIAAGAFTIFVIDSARSFALNVTGIIATDGETIMLDINLQSDHVFLPYRLSDTNFNNYFIGQVGTFGSQAFSGEGPQLSLARGDESYFFVGNQVGVIGAAGRQVSVSQIGLAGLNVTRKIFVSSDGYAARYIESLTNPGPDPVTVDLIIRINLNASFKPPRVLATSSGRDLPSSGGSDPDRWVALGAGPSGRDTGTSIVPYIAAAWDGPSARAASAESAFESGTFLIRWAAVSLAPNERKDFMHFVAQQPDVIGVRVAAERLAGLAPEALGSLNQEDVVSVVNWNLPADGASALPALPALRDFRINGVCKSGDGVTRLKDGVVSVRSNAPLFGRLFTARVNADGTYNLPLVRMPDGPFTLTLSRTVDGLQATATVTGETAPASNTITLDVVLAGTGVITGKVTDANGTPLGFVNVTGADSTTTDANGRFVMPGLPAGLYLIKAQYFNGQQADAFVTLGAGEAKDITLVLPSPGSIDILVTAASGTFTSGLFISTTRLEGELAGFSTTDFDGRATVSNLPAGRYIVRVANQFTSQATQARVSVTEAVTTAATLALPGAGSVQGRVIAAGDTALPGAQVLLIPAGAEDPNQPGNPRPTVRNITEGIQPCDRVFYEQTDIEGRFYFASAPMGDFTLAVYYGGVRGSIEGRIETENELLQMDIPFPAVGFVRVLLLDGEQPLPGVPVEIRFNEGNGNLFGYTEMDGSYISQPVPLGAFVAQATISGRTVAARGELTASGQTLELRPSARTVRITGTLRAADGNPLADTTVEAVDLLTQFTVRGDTDEQGSFDLQDTFQTGDAGIRLVARLQSGITKETLITLAPSQEIATAEITLPVAPVRIAVRAATGARLDDTFSFNLYLRVGEENINLAQSDDGDYFAYLPIPTPSFNAQAEFNGSGLIVSSSGALLEGETSASIALSLPAVGKANAIVIDHTGQPANSMSVAIRTTGASPADFTAFTDSEGRVSFWPVAYGTFALDVSDINGFSFATYTGEITAAEQQVIINLPQPAIVEADPNGVSDSGSAQLRGADQQEQLALYQNLNGSLFRFSPVAPGLVSVARDLPRSSASGRAESGQTLRLRLPLSPESGLIYGEAKESNGTSPLIGVTVTVLDGESGDGSNQQIVLPTLSGRYLVRTARPGRVCVISSDQYGVVQAGSTAMLQSGAALRIDLRNLEKNASRLPVTVGNRQVGQGLVLTGAPFSDDVRLRINGAAFPRLDGARITSNGSGLVCGPAKAGGLVVERQLYANADSGWVRYLEIVENLGSDPIELALDLNGNAAGRAVVASSGSNTASVADRWIVASGSAAETRFAFVFGGSNAAARPAVVSFTSDEHYFRQSRAYRYGWRRELSAGERVAFMHFVINSAQGDPEPLAQLANGLSNLTTPGALNDIGADIRGIIVNFTLD